MVKCKDFSLNMIKEICDILNKGNQCEIKKERENVVIVEIRRKAFSKNQISE